jgi:predicted nuclease with RNAse H fold
VVAVYRSGDYRQDANADQVSSRLEELGNAPVPVGEIYPVSFDAAGTRIVRHTIKGEVQWMLVSETTAANVWQTSKTATSIQLQSDGAISAAVFVFSLGGR